MIPNTRVPASRREWFASPFQRGAKERPLRLVVDWDSIPSGVVRDVLAEVASHPLIDALGTRPTDTTHVEIELGKPQSPDVAVVYRSGEVVSRLVLGELPEAPEPGPAESWRIAIGLAHFTHRAGRDALVTLRSDLFGPFASLAGARGVAVTPAEGVALAGLFLRSRGEFNRTPRRQATIDWRSAEDFYQDLAAVLVPAANLWTGAALPLRSRDLYDESCSLAMSFIRQISRALRARDRVQILSRGEVTLDDACEIATQFEVALLSLSGVFDGLATLSGAIYRLKKSRQEGWTKDTFTEKLRATPGGASLATMATEQPVRLTLEMIAEVRNTVHGPTLTPRVFTSSSRRRAIVGMPPNRVDRFRDILSRWNQLPSDEKWWGVEYHRRGLDDPERPNSYTSTPNDPIAEIWIDPATCLERMLVLALSAMNDIATAMDWSRLPRPDGKQNAGDGFLPLYFLPPGDRLFQERLALLGGVWL